MNDRYLFDPNHVDPRRVNHQQVETCRDNRNRTDPCKVDKRRADQCRGDQKRVNKRVDPCIVNKKRVEHCKEIKKCVDPYMAVHQATQYQDVIHCQDPCTGDKQPPLVDCKLAGHDRDHQCMHTTRHYQADPCDYNTIKELKFTKPRLDTPYEIEGTLLPFNCIKTNRPKFNDTIDVRPNTPDKKPKLYVQNKNKCRPGEKIECIKVDPAKGIPQWQQQCYNKPYCLGSRRPFDMSSPTHQPCYVSTQRCDSPTPAQLMQEQARIAADCHKSVQGHGRLTPEPRCASPRPNSPSAKPNQYYLQKNSYMAYRQC